MNFWIIIKETPAETYQLRYLVLNFCMWIKTPMFAVLQCWKRDFHDERFQISICMSVQVCNSKTNLLKVISFPKSILLFRNPLFFQQWQIWVNKTDLLNIQVRFNKTLCPINKAFRSCYGRYYKYFAALFRIRHNRSIKVPWVLAHLTIFLWWVKEMTHDLQNIISTLEEQSFFCTLLVVSHVHSVPFIADKLASELAKRNSTDEIISSCSQWEQVNAFLS